MQNKLRANNTYMPTKFFKALYIQNCVADNALAQINAQLKNNIAQLLKIVKKMLDVLMIVFGNKNHK